MPCRWKGTEQDERGKSYRRCFGKNRYPIPGWMLGAWIEGKGKGSEVSVRARLVQQGADVRRARWGPQAAHHLVTWLLRGGGPTHGVEWTSSGDLEPTTSFRTQCFPCRYDMHPLPTPTVLGPGS